MDSWRRVAIPPAFHAGRGRPAYELMDLEPFAKDIAFDEVLVSLEDVPCRPVVLHLPSGRFPRRLFRGQPAAPLTTPSGHEIDKCHFYALTPKAMHFPI